MQILGRKACKPLQNIGFFFRLCVLTFLCFCASVVQSSLRRLSKTHPEATHLYLRIYFGFRTSDFGFPASPAYFSGTSMTSPSCSQRSVFASAVFSRLKTISRNWPLTGSLRLTFTRVVSEEASRRREP